MKLDKKKMGMMVLIGIVVVGMAVFFVSHQKQENLDDYLLNHKELFKVVEKTESKDQMKLKVESLDLAKMASKDAKEYDNDRFVKRIRKGKDLVKKVYVVEMDAKDAKDFNNVQKEVIEEMAKDVLETAITQTEFKDEWGIVEE